MKVWLTIRRHLHSNCQNNRVARSMQQTTQTHWDITGAKELFSNPVTLVLYTCRVCDKPHTETVMGHWPLEHFQPLPEPKKFSDAEFMKSAGIRF